jgi:hypothetical protein
MRRVVGRDEPEVRAFTQKRASASQNSQIKAGFLAIRLLQDRYSMDWLVTEFNLAPSTLESLALLA